jgi:GcrA cell cycle regulator
VTAPLGEAELRIALTHGRLRWRGAWQVDLMVALCREWWAGESASKIGRQLGVSKNAVIGKVGRLKARGVLPGRASPLPREPAVPVSRSRPLPYGAHTLPPLPSELRSGASP